MQSVDVKTVLAGVRPGGCVEPYLEGFAAELTSVGYALLPVRDYVRSGAHLGRWMDSCGLEIEKLGERAIARFALHECECAFACPRGQRPSRRYVRRARRFVQYLGRVGVVPPLPTRLSTVVPPLLLEFRDWRIQHRGVKPPTVERNERLVGEMFPSLGDDPGLYDAALVRQVILREIKELTPSYAKTYVAALRQFLRFLAAQGRCRPYLDRAVPSVAEWKLSALPRYLAKDDVERLIASCDVSKPFGVRDRAILLLLARLGLRAGDITGMRLGDLDWEAGTVRVLGKGRKEVRLPLPQDAGEALITYLMNVRPKADTDCVFLCTNAPCRPFSTSSSVSDVVRLALQRAGIENPPSKGAHLLRHSAATAMIRSGASLETIAAVLRHRSSDSTAYYAKVDIRLLREIAQPWPEDQSC